MRSLPVRICVLLAVACGVPLPLAAQTTPRKPGRVLVVYNSSWPDADGNGVADSREVAEYYAAARKVPAQNLCGLALGTKSRSHFTGSTSAQWASFHDNLVTPLKAKLKALGATKIDTILLCYGVPHSISTPSTSYAGRAVDHLIQVPDYLGTRTGWPYTSSWSTNPYFEHSPTVIPDKGRFAHAAYRFAAGYDYYLVSRIDGVHVDAAKDLVDGALYAERHGSKGQGKMAGTVYVDSRHGYKNDGYLAANYPVFSGYTTYQLWSYRMAWAWLLPGKTTLPVKWEYTNYEIGERNTAGKVLATWSDKTPAARADDALFYFGWYNYGQYLDVWTWLPGSVACDLNSNSIQNFHLAGRTRPGFLSEAFERGLTAGCGVISEPYLSGHARPEIVLHYLLEGFTFAEAAALADPALFWRGVRLGDPFYAPYDAGLVRTTDLRPPPQPALDVVLRGATKATLAVRVPHRASDPDLCLAELQYGTTPALGSRVLSRKAYRNRHDLELTGLDANQPGYFCRAVVRDPVGQTGTGPLLAVTARPFTAVEARALALPATVPSGGDLAVRFSVAFATDLSALTSFGIDVRLPGATTYVDVTGAVLDRLSDVGFGQWMECVLFTFKAPKYSGPKGSYDFRLRVATAKGNSSHETRVTVQ